MKTDNKRRIFFIMAIAVLILALSNGMRFTIPLDVINPYEYFYGTERTHFQIMNIFLGGAAVPLAALSGGYMLMTFRDHALVNIILTLVVMFFIALISVVFLFGFDPLPAIFLMLILAALFIRTDKRIVLGAFVLLLLLHIIANGLMVILSGLNSPGDIIYSSIQEVNRFSSTFRSSDYFAIVGLNLEVFFTYQLSEWFMWIFGILPWTLLGIVLHKFNLAELFRNNGMLMISITAALLVGGIIIKMIEVISLGSFTAAEFAERFGGPLLGTGYFMLLFLIFNMLPEKLSGVFGAAGEKGLTVYILSNVIMAVASYGIGFSLYGEVSIGNMTFIIIIIYALLLVIMNVLRRYGIKSLEELSAVAVRKENIK